MFYFLKKVRLFSQNYVLFLFYFLINPTITTGGSNFFLLEHILYTMNLKCQRHWTSIPLREIARKCI